MLGTQVHDIKIDNTFILSELSILLLRTTNYSEYHISVLF